MKYYTWDDAKNKKLKSERNISFEDVVFFIDKGHLLDIIEHPNQVKYKGQKIFVINISDYVYLVPFIETEDIVILKTIIPSRKATRDYLRGNDE